MDRRAQLLARVRQRHVVHLGRALEAGQVVVETEDRRAPVRVVGADALEHRGAVVQAVREHVYLGVGPVDERAVHPDLLGFLHAGGSLARGGGDQITGRLQDRQAGRGRRDAGPWPRR